MIQRYHLKSHFGVPPLVGQNHRVQVSSVSVNKTSVGGPLNFPHTWRMAKRIKTGQEPAGEAPSSEIELSWEHEKFVDTYVSNGGNATAAYQRAYPRAGYGTARTEGARLLAKPHIVDAVEAERSRLANLAQVSRERIIVRLAAQAFADTDDLLEIFKSPLDKNSYRGMKELKAAVSITKNDKIGTEVRTITPAEQRAALNDLWEKLGLDKGIDKKDRAAFLERLLGAVDRKARRSESGEQ
jgi:phage terminase small subunit